MSAVDIQAFDQHQLVEAVLLRAGGENIDKIVSNDYIGKRADVFFEAHGVIVEIKSFTSDRANDPAVTGKLGSILEAGIPYGAPIIFGTTQINTDDLPRSVAERVLRFVGKRAQAEVLSASKQIDESRRALAVPEAYGLIAFIAPPHVLGQQTMRWLIHDLLSRRGDTVGLDGALLIQTDLCSASNIDRSANTFSSLWSISGRPFPDGLGDAIGRAWVEVTGQSSVPTDYSAFVRFGMRA